MGERFSVGFHPGAFVNPYGHVHLAVPVAPPDTLEALRAEADEVVCLSAPLHFDAVGCFYEDFAQTTDDEVVRLLTLARGRAAATTSVPPARAT